MKQREIVNSDELEAALQEREGWQGMWPAVRVIDFRGGTIVEDCAFDSAVDLEIFLLRLILLETRQVTPSSRGPWQGEVLSAAVNPSMLRCLRQHAGLFDTFIEATCGIGHWYSAKHVCYGSTSLSSDIQNPEEVPKRFETDIIICVSCVDIFYEYIPQEKRHSCTQLSTDFQSTTYFFLDLPAPVLARFMRDVAEDGGELSTRFFYLDTLIADEAMRTWQKDIALKRTALKSLDQTVEHSKVDNQSIHELHALAREWHILARNLSDYAALLEFFKSAASRYHTLSATHHGSTTPNGAMLGGSLEYLVSSCQSLTYLVSDYSGRTKTRIDLLYHLANQAESQSTRELAELARQDSAAMLTIAAVTLLFLPGTFIAVRTLTFPWTAKHPLRLIVCIQSILSTTIFNFADGEMQVYRKWWVFPVTVVPFTILVFAIWFAWLGRKRGGQKHRYM
ncbi:hypothetical protein BBK36DRAFT_1108044 [Trichoderma citrinoviride]|uniref:Cora-domain-containing protein n=1 Tax=Trichoderma citrinoviride TaxID=58853 RepID=A0A2T4BNH6_9HYPO|nr:hypothetical protein BBK36DRAFT_1108044 [Trichoderma citrinoviride]PTB70809.1 hypothetical protein BBK36DRAFT_1108044 [Trichoderma citrinoviride]